MTRFGITRGMIMAQFAALCFSMLLSALFGPKPFIWILLNGIVVIIAIVDFIITPGRNAFSCERIIPGNFEQSNEAEIELVIRKLNDIGPVYVRITDSPPRTFQSQCEVVSETFSGVRLHHKYRATPLKRGAFPFGKCYLEVRGRLGLCTKHFTLSPAGLAKVYPNLAPMRHYRLLAERRQLSREDSALHKIKGFGAEFAGLRDYSAGDDIRKINWKATARAEKLITNIYDMEKNRDVIIAVDTGRWMQADMALVTRLDRALELAAAIMQVALSSGDRVGLVLFDTEVSCYYAPGKGLAHLNNLLASLYEAQTKSAASSFLAMGRTIRKKLKKRAYIFILSYLDSPLAANQVVSELMLLERRHALYFASLADVGMEELLNKKTISTKDIYLKTAAAYRKKAELDAVSTVKKYNIAACAAEPSELLTHSIRHYLSLKQMLR